MRRSATFFAILLVAPLLFARSPRVSFERVLPAPHDLGKARRLAVKALPKDPLAERFLEEFLDRVNRSGFLEIHDGRGQADSADLLLEAVSFDCNTATRETEGSVRDVDGNRVKRKLYSVDAVCLARIDVFTPGRKRLSSFYGKGEGTSPNLERVSPDQRDDALRHAIRLAAVSAADRITPRRVRESIALDEHAPGLDDALAMLAVDRLAEARAVFERELQRHPRSAPLRFNLGVMNEALGDRVAAERQYNAAKALAPDEPRYAVELKRFARRGP